ncbi:MAG: hypothetical protein ACRDOD_16560, partial [Streptosporangiaceae bacterium]
LDTYCCAGGAGMGYHRAGFDVTGVDIEPRARYPFPVIQADALEVLADRKFLARFAAIHASPPCPDHMQSPMRGQQPHGTGWMLGATRKLLIASGKPWVIENVPGAPMRVDVELCGCQVGLPEIERKRWFETSWGLFLLLPPCHHPVPVVNPMRTKHGPWYREHGRVPTRMEVAAAMGIDWMRGEEIKQAVPPAMTELIGGQLLEHLTAAAA